MADWKNVKKEYNDQTKFWIKIPKLADHYTEENLKNKFNGVDCFEFLFKQFNREQIIDLVVTDGETAKETVKKSFDKFIFNIIDWKNVTVDDIVKNDNKELLNFDNEALDEFFAVNFWVTQFVINQVNNTILERKSQITDQKKT
jgi:hypothetical protein